MVVRIGGMGADPGGAGKGRRRVVAAMLEAGQEVCADVLGKLERPAQAVCEIERGAELVVLLGCVGLEHERIAGWPLEHSVAHAGDRIGRDPEAERRHAGGEEVLPVVLARIGVRIGELHVRVEPVRAGLVDPGPVEHPPSGLVLVEAEVEEVALVHPRGRAAKGVRARDSHLRTAQRERVRVARVVTRLVPQEGADVPRHRVGKPHHHRILGRVDQLVEPVGLEPVEEADVRGRRHERGRSARAPAERPAARVDRRPGPAHGATHREARVRRVHVGGLVGAEARVALQRQRERPGLGNGPVAVLDPDPLDDGTAVRLHRDREAREEPVVAGRHVALPSGVDDGVAQAHEESVSRIGGRDRVVDARPGERVVEVPQGLLVPAVVDHVEDPPVPARHDGRLEDEERRAELDVAARVARGLVEVDDHRVVRVARIDLEVRGAVEPLILADATEAGAVGESAHLRHLEPHHAGMRGAGGEQEQRSERDRSSGQHGATLLSRKRLSIRSRTGYLRTSLDSAARTNACASCSSRNRSFTSCVVAFSTAFTKPSWSLYRSSRDRRGSPFASRSALVRANGT